MDDPILPRKLAFRVLLRYEQGLKGPRLKADALIRETLASGCHLSARDEGFVHAMTMAVLRDWYLLDAWIGLLTNCPMERLRPSVRVLLRMGLIQLAGNVHASPYAAVHTTVELARARKESVKTLKFINAILREAQRRMEHGDFAVPPPVEADLSEHLLLQYGWSPDFTRLVTEQSEPESNPEALTAMARAVREQAPLSIRVNTLAIEPDAYLKLLLETGLKADCPDPEIPEGFTIRHFSGSPAHLPGYGDGFFYVQDLSSMRVARRLAPRPGECALDLCAAPGSKTTHMAALMENAGRITAIEPKAARAVLLQENLQRLKVGNTEVLTLDALDYAPPDGLYDRVLVDAPCSGSGTIRRHPEILLYLSRPDFSRAELSAYANHQRALLRKGFQCLKPGGLLVYSTCSVFRTENQEAVRALLADNPDAHIEDEEQWPVSENADGFYVACIRKVPR